MVKIEILEETENHVSLLLKETDRAFANAMRRTLMSNVPKMAIHRVRFELGTITDSQTGEVYESIGALPDEVIAHRLAMVPIPTFHDEFCFLEDDPGNAGLPREEWGTPASQIIYHCSARGTPEGHLVTAGDLNVLGEDKLQIPELYRDIPITKLFAGQYLEFYAYAVLGVGSDHTKWSPVSGVSFKSRKIATLEKPTKAKVLWDLDLSIKKSDFKNKKLEDVHMVEKLIEDMHHVGAGTARIDDFADAITLEDVPGEYLFSFDTDGSMTPRTAFAMACKSLSSRFGDILEQLSEDL
ncbi:MAG: DNA-directed RNA polymerase subunit D [Candidatus Thalassarchaeum sp.]|nr:DNA-directed RNA polymerase subunit D [Candidatus Thalassarchaeum sp.]